MSVQVHTVVRRRAYSHPQRLRESAQFQQPLRDARAV
jgi:hypothetical protein